MIDVSDGLVADLGHIAVASGVTLNVGTQTLPGARELSAAAAALGTDWHAWALGGGEDHALAATFPEMAGVPDMWTLIGTVGRGGGVLVDGQVWTGPAGWDHFPKLGG